jgi:uncharacterized protein (DUF2141 family)
MKTLLSSFLILGAVVFANESQATAPTTDTAKAENDSTHSLNVIVHGVRNNSGSVVVSLCHQGEKFPGGCTLSAQGKAVKGNTKVTFSGLLKGNYAAALFHDENSDGKLTFIQEGIAFSNDSNLAFGQPQFDPASFDLNGDKKIKINMRYFN